MNRVLIAAATAGAVLLLAASNSSNSSTDANKSSASPGMSGMNMGPGSGGTAPPMLNSSASVSAQHNTADGDFANNMTSHHAGAIEMANMEAIDGYNRQVIALAKKIQTAQQPEIDLMNGFLKTWGIAPAGHQGEGSMSMPGMMTAAQSAAFFKLKGTELDKTFLTLMIAHHQGALEMSKTELTQGINPQAKALAQSITTSQTAEIATLKQLLTQL